MAKKKRTRKKKPSPLRRLEHKQIYTFNFKKHTQEVKVQFLEHVPIKKS